MTPNRTIDLNADVGEATDAAGTEVERTLLGLVTTAHVATGSLIFVTSLVVSLRSLRLFRATARGLDLRPLALGVAA